MSVDHEEVARREKAALAAIKTAYGTDEDTDGVTLFVSHHLNELDGTYWQKHLNNTLPDPRRVLDILELRSHWGGEGEDGLDTFDFTLPDYVTDYVISVHFDRTGEVKDITMES